MSYYEIKESNKIIGVICFSDDSFKLLFLEKMGYKLRKITLDKYNQKKKIIISKDYE